MNGKKLEYKGEEALKEIERLTKHADEVQQNILKDILKQNGDTEYLKNYIKINEKCCSSNDIVAEFKRCVPVVTFSRIFPYIQRIANGEDSSLISGHKITELLCRFCSFLCLVHSRNFNVLTFRVCSFQLGDF